MELEEVKDKEIAKLQNSMRDMQSKLGETNTLPIREYEAAPKAFEEDSLIVDKKPILVEDEKSVEALTAELKNLKVLKVSW